MGTTPTPQTCVELTLPNSASQQSVTTRLTDWSCPCNRSRLSNKWKQQQHCYPDDSNGGAGCDNPGPGICSGPPGVNCSRPIGISEPAGPFEPAGPPSAHQEEAAQAHEEGQGSGTPAPNPQQAGPQAQSCRYAPADIDMLRCFSMVVYNSRCKLLCTLYQGLSPNLLSAPACKPDNTHGWPGLTLPTNSLLSMYCEPEGFCDVK